MNRIFELIDEIGFPPGVLNLIHGDKSVVQTLIEHPDIVGICSVTSTPVARYISSECAKFGKRFLCQGGAKNFISFSESLLKNPQAFELSVQNTIDSVYGNTNQRCMAGSNVVGIGKIYPALIEKFVEEAKKIKVGYGLDSATMGPLISKSAKEKVLEFIEMGIKEGAKLILDGRETKVKDYPRGHYLGPTIFVDVEPQITIAREEIFGPVALLMKVNSLTESIDLINNQTSKFNNYRYGNAAMLYTDLGGEAREFKLKVKCGDIGINIGLPAPIAYFPFAGMRDSFYGIMHGQLPDVIRFFMDVKVITERWW
jgi:malonate-semialdehyde dehydrogenase (acetylating)/methylmalonate-semialdehyde dehydrogenase